MENFSKSKFLFWFFILVFIFFFVTKVDAIKNKISEFKTKGAEILTNIQNGIESKTTEVVTNMKNFAENLKSAVKDKGK